MKTQVIIHVCVEGLHRWKDAPEEVAFLRAFHRHVFQIRCYLDVDKLDREREIFIEQGRLKKAIHEKYGKEPCNFGELSCEMIAREILDMIDAQTVEVLEDGFGGAQVTR